MNKGDNVVVFGHNGKQTTMQIVAPMKATHSRMKYPEILSATTMLARQRQQQIDTIIDVRTASEFAEDHLPGAINCPVLDDAQRIEVGTLYRQVNAFEAKKRGAAMVARNVAQHLETLFLDRPREWRPLIYCWRGGNRSGAMAHIFAKVGWPVMQLDGGYKQYRELVRNTLAQWPAQFALRIVSGPTGSGKSRLLQALAAQGAQVVDLEQLAVHRGSLLGDLPQQAQPSQKMFESRIWHILRNADPARPIFLEAESKKIGKLCVPESLLQQMRAAPCISLSLPLSARIALLMEDYQHFVQAPQALVTQLEALAALHGKEQIRQWQALAQSGHLSALQALVQQLLQRHYDPAYGRSIARNFLQVTQAQQITLADASAASFHHAATQLLQAGHDNQHNLPG